MNAKIYTGNVQPNHKEFKIWVNDEGLIKTWNGQKWVECSGGSSSDDKIIYYELHDGYIRDNIYDYLDGALASIKTLVFGKYCFGYWANTDKDDFSGNYPLKAVAFLPMDIDFDEEDGESIHMHFDDLESLLATMRKYNWDAPDGPFIKRRITAEEYWDTSIPESTFTIAMYDYEFTGSGGTRVEGAHNTYVIKEYTYGLGMTFKQWAQSKYNTDGFIVEGSYIQAKCIANGSQNIGVVMKNYEWINGDTIIDNMILHNIDEENGGEVFANLKAFVPEG